MNASKNILPFLIELKQNNNKEWFDANKDWFIQAKTDFETIVGQILHALTPLDSQLVGLTAKECVFRIYRDVRFSKNKAPYKDHFGAYMAAGGRKSDRAGYYIHIEHNNSFVATGAYCPPAPFLREIRENIVDNPLKFKNIIEHPTFANNFELMNEKVKTAPRGFDKNFEHLELIKYKNYIGTSKLSNQQVAADNYVTTTTERFKQGIPLNNYLNYIAINMDA